MIDILKIAEISPPFKFGIDLTTAINSGLPLYCYGKASISSGFPLYTQGAILLSYSLPLYTTGKGSSSQGVNLYTSGRNANINGCLSLYTQGYDPHPNSNLAMFCYVSNIGAFSGGVNMFARVKEGGTLAMFCQSQGIPQNSSLLMFSAGILGLSGGLVMSLPNTKTAYSNYLPMYTRGW